MFHTAALCLLSLPFFLITAAQKVVVVQVFAGGMLVYQPNDITAPNGTIVSFSFPQSTGHSVTQTSFGSPCVYLPNGFNSGIVTKTTQFNLTITDDTKPIWFYCEEDHHCGMGMVGGINAPTTGNTTAAFTTAAIALGGSEPAQNESAPVVSSGIGAQVFPSSTSPATSTPTSSSSAKPSNGAAKLAISGVGITFLAGVASFIVV